MKKLALIDGYSLLHRAFYATPVFSTHSGNPTNGIFGFIKIIFKIIDSLNPDFMIVAFDRKEPTFRHEMYPEYKGNRKAMPDDLAVQVKPLKELLEAMHIAVCEKAGFEADDIIGALSVKYKDVKSYIYTGDMDSFQLVSENTEVYFTKRGVSDLRKLNKANFKAETGLERPSQIVDLKALMGDKSDNIPGVAGVGEKTALSLLSKYDTLSAVYDNIDGITGSLKDKLLKDRERAFLSYKLATIDTDCEVDISLENCVTPLKYSSEVKKMFAALEFTSMLAMNVFEEAEQEEKSIDLPETVECYNLDFILKQIGDSREFSVCFDDGVQIFAADKLLDVRITEDGRIGDGLMEYEYTELLKTIFSSEENRVVLFDSKSVLHILRQHDVGFKCSFEDVSIQKYLCEFVAANFTMRDLCNYHMFDYSVRAYALKKISDLYSQKIIENGVEKLYEEIEKPLVYVLFEMETAGVKISKDEMEKMGEQLSAEIEQCKSKVRELCGVKINLNSPAQLGAMLYERLGIKEVKKRSGKYTTGADVLEKIRDKHPSIEYILKFRTYQKLYSNYIEAFRSILGRDSVIHTTYNQTITTTGRLSSANPNLQNIPVREEGKELRKMFVPREGNIFIDADYSQIELRLLAHFSGCKELIEAYNRGDDIHSITASQVFGVALEEVTPSMRKDAKAVNFGIIYGISEFGLANNLNIEVDKAKEYIEKYFQMYASVKEYMLSNVEYAKEHGYVSTLTGRKRWIPEIKSSNYSVRQFGERAAMNMPLQGSSADIIKIAMNNVCNALKREGLKTKMILQVHDELVLEAPVSECESAAKILKYEMENAVKLSVPLTVDIHSGSNWFEAK